MPDEVNVERMTGEHTQGHKTTSWITVGLLSVATIVLGIAFVAQSVPLAVVGGILALAGLVLGITGKIMEDVH